MSGASPAPTGDIEAYEQLAIYYEHRARHPQRAAEITRAALAELRNALRHGLLDAARHSKLRARLASRLLRLERKAPREFPHGENCQPDSGRRIESARRRI